MSMLGEAKEIIMDYLEDGKKATFEDIKREVLLKNPQLNDGAVKNALYYLKNKEFKVKSKEGRYCKVVTAKRSCNDIYIDVTTKIEELKSISIFASKEKQELGQQEYKILKQMYSDIGKFIDSTDI